MSDRDRAIAILHTQGAPDADEVLTCVEARELVEKIQEILWLDVDYQGDYWNADKEWDSDTISAVAQALIDAGLRPTYGDYHLP